MTHFPQLPLFTPQEVITANPLFFPWIPVPLQGHAQQVPSQASMETQQPPLWQPGSGMQEVGLRGSFTEISTLKHTALMIFPEREDKKYVHICPVTLVKCSFDLRPAVNTTFAKYAVVMTPILLPIRFPNEDDPLIVNPQITYTPMINPTSFIVWNIKGEIILPSKGILESSSTTISLAW
ncbi:hypothetical protein H5410_001332 [Solanum commersonii]|uniref:Uncharacterized protein n=1 Tax=Solanum commersonii TaxID=4109 RepID=A0A9J6AZU1_SOLCO|nr:hypothetical protein H5410_001332 [Solanum commersonii]